MSAAEPLVDCQACGHPVDPVDPQPCEEGGVCRAAPQGLAAELLDSVARRTAYTRGYAAAGRGTDLDAAETRYLRRNGHEHVDDWARGWEDRANGRPRRP